ncbi:MAG: hypothetical protein KY454_11665, partial [Actinobacteria bacterium]|nr:hypothetical protein [Actinomycetota bacterium]
MPLFRQLRLVALAAALLMVAASCGQKPGVALSAGSGRQAADEPSLESGAETVPTGEEAVAPAEPTAPAPAAGPAAAPTATRPGATAAAPRAPAPGQAAPAPAPAAAAKQDRTGIDDAKKEIVIGIHAPVTGAAPIEQKTFENGRDVYWQFVRDNGGILGGY